MLKSEESAEKAKRKPNLENVESFGSIPELPDNGGLQPLSRFESEEFKMNFSFSASHEEINPLVAAKSFLGFSLRQKKKEKSKERPKKLALSDLDPSLKLGRTLKLEAYPILKKFPGKKKDDEKENADPQVIKEFAGLTILTYEEVHCNELSEAKDVWAGLIFSGADGEFLLTSHGLAKWHIEEFREEKSTLASETTFSGWKIEKAEVVWDDKGPYLKLSCEDKDLVNIYPLEMGVEQIKRFQTDFSITSSPPVPSIIKGESEKFSLGDKKTD